MNAPTLKQLALAYHDYGLTIVPVAARGKNPIPVDWPNLRMTRMEVQVHWNRYPNHNLGILTGATGFVVIDCDGPAWVEWGVRHFPFTPLRTVSGSGNSGHLIFRWPAGVPVATKRGLHTGLFARPKEHEGADFYGDGVQIVAPGSVHETGGIYAWHDRSLMEPLPPLEDVPIFDLAWLPEGPVQERPESVRPKANRSAGLVGRGDYSTLDIVGLFQDAGLYLGHISEDKHAVSCPWAAEHSPEKRRQGTDTSTAVWESSTSRWPGFFCYHTHCSERGFWDVVAHFGADTIDRFCGSTWQPPRPAGDTVRVARGGPATRIPRRSS